MTKNPTKLLVNLLADGRQYSDKSGLITCTHDARLRLGQGRPGFAKIAPWWLAAGTPSLRSG